MLKRVAMVLATIIMNEYSLELVLMPQVTNTSLTSKVHFLCFNSFLYTILKWLWFKIVFNITKNIA